MTNCGMLGRTSATRSPLATPSLRSPFAKRQAASEIDRYERFALKKIVAVASGWLSAASSRSACSGTAGYASAAGTPGSYADVHGRPRRGAGARASTLIRFAI